VNLRVVAAATSEGPGCGHRGRPTERVCVPDQHMGPESRKRRKWTGAEVLPAIGGQAATRSSRAFCRPSRADAPVLDQLVRNCPRRWQQPADAEPLQSAERIWRLCRHDRFRRGERPARAQRREPREFHPVTYPLLDERRSSIISLRRFD
jgi:hypothetical protein